MRSSQSIINAVPSWRECGLRIRALHFGIQQSRLLVMAVLAVAVTASVYAHHSFEGVYDGSRMLTVRGTVAEVHFINPHIRIVVEQIDDDGNALKDPGGSAVRWVGETMSIRVAQRRNFTRHSLKAGQVISLRGWLSKKEGVREMGVSEIIQESGHVFSARQRIGGGRRVPPAPYPGVLPGSP